MYGSQDDSDEETPDEVRLWEKGLTFYYLPFLSFYLSIYLYHLYISIYISIYLSIHLSIVGEKRKSQDDSDEETPDEVRLWEKGFKDRYYESKFDVSCDDIEFRYR